MFKRTSAFIIIAIIVMHLPFVPAWGQGGVEAEHVFGFAESLYEEGDYFRAIGEYKRYLYLFAPTADPHSTLVPSENRAEKAAFRIAECYFHAKRWSEAIIACNHFLSRYPGGSRYFEMLYLKGRVEKLSGSYEDALQTFAAIVVADAPDYGDKARYQKALVRLEQNNWRGAQEALRLVPRGSKLFPAASAFALEIDQKENLPRKSSVTAGLCAAILPGAGHLYAERPRDALVAFLLNGAFTWGAVELFQDRNYVAGGILAFFELGWYTGNIYSAVSSVHKYNRDQENNLIQKLKNKFSLALIREKGGSAITLSQRF